MKKVQDTVVLNVYENGNRLIVTDGFLLSLEKRRDSGKRCILWAVFSSLYIYLFLRKPRPSSRKPSFYLS